MFPHPFKRRPGPVAATLLIAWLCALPSALPAQTAPAAVKAASADPADPGAAVPPAVYRSVLADFDTSSAPGGGDWKAANELTLRIGGWRSYLRLANEPEGAAPAAPKAGAHSGHAHPATPGGAKHE